MPLTRSRENLNLMDLDEPSNCSFTVSVENENPTGQTRTRRITRSQTTRNIDRGDGDHISDEIRIRSIVSDSISSFREEI